MAEALSRLNILLALRSLQALIGSRKYDELYTRLMSKGHNPKRKLELLIWIFRCLSLIAKYLGIRIEIKCLLSLGKLVRMLSRLLK